MRTVADHFATAMSEARPCPKCDNTQPPEAATPRALGWLLRYTCAGCGATWTDNWTEI